MADNCGIDILILILIVLFTIFLMTFILNNKIEKEKELYQMIGQSTIMDNK